MFLHETLKHPFLESKGRKGLLKHSESIFIPLIALGLSCYDMAGHEDIFASLAVK